jgi:hypothetical protein
LINYTITPIVQNTHLINSNNYIRQYSAPSSSAVYNPLTLIQQPHQTTYLQSSLITSPQSAPLAHQFISPNSNTTQNSFNSNNNNSTTNNTNAKRCVFFDDFNNDDFLP